VEAARGQGSKTVQIFVSVDKECVVKVARENQKTEVGSPGGFLMEWDSAVLFVVVVSQSSSTILPPPPLPPFMAQSVPPPTALPWRQPPTGTVSWFTCSSCSEHVGL